MSRTFRFLRAAGNFVSGDHPVKDRSLRPLARPAKKSFHHRARRAVTRWIAGQIQEAI
jgi:hypothetical protein